MTSQLEAVVVGEFFSRAVGECDCPKNGDVLSNDSQRLETDTIQKFLSVCLKQYFHCFPDNTKVSSFSETLLVSWISIFPLRVRSWLQ